MKKRTTTVWSSLSSSLKIDSVETSFILATGITIFLSLVLSSCKQPLKNTKLSGPVFGTTYNVIYNSEIDYQIQFDSLFYQINKSMSTYIHDSDISKINRNESITVDQHFKRVLKASKKICGETNGAFDPTIGAVLNAWDFGPQGQVEQLDSLKIDSLMLSVGLHKVLLVDDRVQKPEGTFLDFNAIAKGYAVDVIGLFLEEQGVENYLVEIGGEIRGKGINVEKEDAWMVGIDEPNFDGSQSVLKTIQLENSSMATSGTYRKFKVDENGNRYAHIIDTKTGYPSKTNILSVSVIAPDCMSADAYATTFQAMGIEAVREFVANRKMLKVHFVYENRDKELETLTLNDFPD